jgi:hypothetical protein
MTTYLIVPASRLDQLAGRSGFIQKRAADARRSVDGTKALVKYSGAKPQALVNYEAINGPVTTYTHEQILEEMEKPAWTPEFVERQPTLLASATTFSARYGKKIAAGAAAAATAASYWLLS